MKIPMCWKCKNRIESWLYDDVRTVEGCTKDRNINNFEDAKEMCPLLKEKE